MYFEIKTMNIPVFFAALLFPRNVLCTCGNKQKLYFLYNYCNNFFKDNVLYKFYKPYKFYKIFYL